jgi:hypothetical protein
MPSIGRSAKAWIPRADQPRRFCAARQFTVVVVTDSRIEKWQRWLEQPIESEILSLHHHRHIYRQVTQIANENPDLPPSLFLDFLSDAYATAQAVGVRRTCEVNPRVSSLGQLLSEISNDADRLTREFWVGLFSADLKDLGERGWRSQYAGKTGDHLDPSIPARDLEALLAGAAAVSSYVDRYLAHSDPQGLDELPTYSDLDRAVDLIGEMFKKYSNLLTASSWAYLEPTPQEDWLAVFRLPWIKP